MSIRRLYLIRHGQYDTSNKTSDGGALTSLGREQARVTGEYFQQAPITSIHCSTMTRARETAALIAEYVGLEPQPSNLLREAIPSIPPRAAEQILGMLESNPNFTHDNIHRDKQRADQAFDLYFAPNESADPLHELLVCHGNIMRYLVCKALGINTDTWAKMFIHHCGISIVEVNEVGQARLMSHNETGHLPANLISDS